MAGLLDFLDSDEGRMGIGLLMAGSKRSDGAGFGQRLGESMSYVQAQRENDAKRRFQQVQMDNYNSEIEARKLAGVKDARQQAFIADYYNRQNQGGLLGGATSPGAFTPSIDGMGPTMPPQAAQRQGGRLASMTIDDIQELKDRGGIDHMEAWKTAKQGFERKPGSFYEDGNGNTKYIASPEKGITYENGTIGLMKGSENLAKLKGQEALMTELPKAMLAAGGRVNLRTNSDNTQTPVSEYTENPAFQEMIRSLGMPGGDMQRPSPARPPSAQPMPQPQRPLIGAGYNGGSTQNAAQGQLEIMQSELAKMSLDDRDRPGLMREIARLGGVSQQTQQPLIGVPQQSGAPRYGMTNQQTAQAEANTAFAVDSSKAGSDRIMKGYDGAQIAVESLISNVEARKSLTGGSFLGTGAETKLSIAKAIQGMGFDVAADKVTNTDYLQSTLGQGILNKAKTLGSNPTDNDARIVKAIVGSIGTDPQALNKLLDHQDVMSNRAITQHNKNYSDAKTRGFDAGFDLNVSGPANAPDKPAKSATPAPPQAMKGMVRGGYKFKGGDPSDKNNWVLQ